MRLRIDYYKILKYSLIPVNLLLVITFVLNYFHFLPTYWKSVYVFYFALIINTAFFTLKIKHIPYNKGENHTIVYFSKYFFLLSLIVLASNQFLKRQIIIDNLSYIIGVSISLGFLTFYSNKDKVQQELEQDKNKEDENEKLSRNESSEKYRRLNKLPIVKKVVKCLHGKVGKYMFWLSFTYIIFALIQIYKIYHTGIGTDEGNFLYTTKLILIEHKIPYLDFYVREAGSLLFLIPWFKIFKISIINLRWFVFIIHTFIFFIYYLFMKEFSDNKKIILTVLLISSIVLQLNGPLDFYQGIFYQLFNLFFVFILFLFYKYYVIISKLGILWLIGLLIGVSISIYEPAMFLLLIFSLIIIFKEDYHLARILKNLLSLFVFSSTPLLIYLIYFALKTSFTHIYLVLFNQILLLLVLIIISVVVVIFLINKCKRIKHISLESLIILSNIILYSVFLYKIIIDPDPDWGFFSSFYGAFIFGFGFLIFILQILNLKLANKYRKPLLYFYLCTNILFLVNGFKDNTFYENVPSYLHYLAALIFLIFNVLLLVVNFNQNEQKEQYFMLILSLNLFLSAYLLATYSMVPRFLIIIMPLLPILFLLIIKLKIKMNYSLFLLFLSLFLSLFINSSITTTYTLYTKNQFDTTVNFILINLDKDEPVFSLDTAFLSEIDNPSIVLFHSPFIFRTPTGIIAQPGYFYEGLGNTFPNSDISLNKNTLIERIKNRKPEYIIGSTTYTFQLFKIDELKTFIYENYTLIYENGRIKIYRNNE